MGLKMITKYLKIFNNLEINKSTDDVETDIKYLNFKNKLKYYGFYALVVGASAYIYMGSLHSIEANSFNKQLIKQANVSPLMTLFYSDFSSEKQETTKEIQNNSKKITLLQAKIKQNQNFSYPYSQFLNDVKSGKIDVDFDNILKKAREKYMKAYFLATLTQDKKTTVKLGSKEYSYLAISKKLSTFDRQTLQKAIMIPVHVILLKLNLKATNDNVMALKSALRSLIYLNGSNLTFYKNLKISKNADNLLKKAVENDKQFFKIQSGFLQENIALPTLNSAYQKEKAIKKTEYNSKLKQMKADNLKHRKAIEKLSVKVEKEKELVQAINRLQNNVSNYDSNKKVVEKIIKEIK